MGADADAGAGPQCIVVTPTRELAIQIHNEARKFAQGSMIKSVVAYGGTSVFYQASQLQRGCNILVASLGRLHDFVEKGRVSLSHCKVLVLDEADRMLDMGFMPEIQKMAENEDMPKKALEGNRQCLMFCNFPRRGARVCSRVLGRRLPLPHSRPGGRSLQRCEAGFLRGCQV